MSGQITRVAISGQFSSQLSTKTHTHTHSVDILSIKCLPDSRVSSLNPCQILLLQKKVYAPRLRFFLSQYLSYFFLLLFLRRSCSTPPPVHSASFHYFWDDKKIYIYMFDNPSPVRVRGGTKVTLRFSSASIRLFPPLCTKSLKTQQLPLTASITPSHQITSEPHRHPYASSYHTEALNSPPTHAQRQNELQ